MTDWHRTDEPVREKRREKEKKGISSVHILIESYQKNAFTRKMNLPQMLSGASSSKSIGCCRNISRDFKHNPRTSCSVIWTALPGRHFFTETTTKTESDYLKWLKFRESSGVRRVAEYTNKNGLCFELSWSLSGSILVARKSNFAQFTEVV